MANVNIINVDLEDYDQYSVLELERTTQQLERELEVLTGKRWDAIDDQDEKTVSMIEERELLIHRRLIVLENVITAKEVELYGHQPFESRY